MSRYSEQQKEYKTKLKLCRRATVQYRKVGNTLRIILPKNIQEVLENRITVDETSKTGIRWTSSERNNIFLRGNPAGSKLGNSGAHHRCPLFKYAVGVTIDKIAYRIPVSHVVWMLAHKDKPIGDNLVDHIDGNPLNNKVSNLRLVNNSESLTNRRCATKSGYKNVVVARSSFIWTMRVNGKTIRSSIHKSKHKVLILGWEILTSGKISLNFVKCQSLEYLDGTYLQRALAECEKQGIAVTPPKFKTLYEYIAFVENNAN